MSTDGYNGYPNYATWNANLWFSETGFDMVLESKAERLLQADVIDPQDHAEKIIASLIEDTITHSNPLADQNGMYSDMLTHMLVQVDCRYIARLYVSEAAQRVLDV